MKLDGTALPGLLRGDNSNPGVDKYRPGWFWCLPQIFWFAAIDHRIGWFLPGVSFAQIQNGKSLTASF